MDRSPPSTLPLDTANGSDIIVGASTPSELLETVMGDLTAQMQVDSATPANGNDEVPENSATCTQLDQTLGNNSQAVFANVDPTATNQGQHQGGSAEMEESPGKKIGASADTDVDLKSKQSCEEMGEVVESPSNDVSMGYCRSIEEASVNTVVELTTDSPVKTSLDSAENEATAPEAKQRSFKLTLTPEEDRLFQLLEDAATAYESGRLQLDAPTDSTLSARGGFTKDQRNATSDGGTNGEETAPWLVNPPRLEKQICLRVAGGWVRDKLLKQHSVDVDVALDCMMGVQFARIVQSYMSLVEKERLEELMAEQTKETDVVDRTDSVPDVEMPMVGNTNNVAEELRPEPNESDQPKSKRKKNKKKQHSTQPKIVSDWFIGLLAASINPQQMIKGVIGANPSQSKHLETATMNIHGCDIDFVNLRAEEVYELNSRIPTSKTRMFGSPLEDALRRDFTINSLFYNIRTRRIEDWTGRGLTDLIENRRIVTPVDAHVTFHDDPLRVLRAIRFCVRLDFTLDEQTREAAASKRVHHSLHVKVSRERVGKEVEGMLTGKHARPGRALGMIADLKLAGSVFAFPGSFSGDSNYAGGPVTGDLLGQPYNCSLGSNGQVENVEDRLHREGTVEVASKQRKAGWNVGQMLLGVLPGVMEGHAHEREEVSRLSGSLVNTAVDERLLHLCVFIAPFHDLSFPDKKGRDVKVTSHMIKDALKFSVRDGQAVTKILSHFVEISDVLGDIREQLALGAEANSAGLKAPCRLKFGLLLRSLKENWVTCLLTAATWEIRSRQRPIEVNGDSQNELDWSGPQETERAIVSDEQPSRELYRMIVSELGLDGCWNTPPHLNGKDLIKELGLPKGPVVGEYLDDQVKWMLLNPEGTKEQCLSHLRECKVRREGLEGGGECVH